MKRASRLYEQIADLENLRHAFYKAARRKRDRIDVRHFAADLEHSLLELRARLLNQQLRVGEASTFTIYDPKQRVITAPCFRDRVLHHAIMNVCEPIFERFLINDTFACRVGKGRIAALHRAMDFSARFKYAIKLDVRKYFASIPGEELVARLQRRFKDPRLISLFRQIIRSHAEASSGLPIGSLTSQHFANFYLGWFDRFVKEQLRVRGFVRYMDDSLLWSNDRSALLVLAESCRGFLRDELGLTLRNSLPLFRSACGIDFLGCRVFPDHLKLNGRSRRRYRAKLRDLDEQFARAVLTERELQDRSESLTAFTFAGGTRSWKFRQHVLQHLPVSGHGLEPGEPGRQLEQQLRELPFGEPQQEHAG